jgi:hypothetical protein
MTKQTFTLTVGPDMELNVLADNSGRLWNGFPVPILTAEQAEIVGRALGETLTAGPADGLTWETPDYEVVRGDGRVVRVTVPE